VNANIKGAYLSDLEALRTRARQQIMKGAVTPSYPEADRLAIVGLLILASVQPTVNGAASSPDDEQAVEILRGLLKGVLK